MEEYSIAKPRITFKRNTSLLLYYYYTVFHGFSANLQVVLTIDKQILGTNIMSYIEYIEVYHWD